MEEPKQKKIPVLPWMRNPVDLSLSEECPLDDVPLLDPRLKDALRSKGYCSLFQVQYEVWKQTIGPGQFERDLCVNSATGSGKTLSYALPIVQKLSTRNVTRLRALIVLPSHSLAEQVKGEFDSIASAVGLSVGLASGQTSKADDMLELIKQPNHEASVCYDPEYRMPELESAVDILVATPGKLMDHIKTTKGFTLEHLQFLVVDETEKLLKGEYQSWLPTVLKFIHSDEESLFAHLRTSESELASFRTIRRSGIERGFKGKIHPRLVKMILSATLTQDPSKLSQLELHHPLLLTGGRYKLPDRLRSYKLVCKSIDKPLHLVALLQELSGEKTIVFRSSVEKTHELSILLNCFENLQFKVKEYSSGQPKHQRSNTLKAFRKGAVEVLVCSDVMSRGMDIEDVTNVINYDAPSNIKAYVHRAGRTARAGQAGRCFTFLRRNEVLPFKDMLQKVDINSCSEHPISADTIERLRPLYTTASKKMEERTESKAPSRRKKNLRAKSK